MTTKLGKFKLGPAKTLAGCDAEILKIVAEEQGAVIGAFKDRDGVWAAMKWRRDGVALGDNESVYLMSNVEPERVTFKATWVETHGPIHPEGPCVGEILGPFINKHCKVTVEVLDD